MACLARQQVEDHHSDEHYKDDVGGLQRLRDSLRLRHGLHLLCLLRNPPGLGTAWGWQFVLAQWDVKGGV